ncbi:hypothetical protein Taro_009436 [Colocasia esculenta]|uniref:Uncharacterized protein n=1 Tax=Colocasia esculenta TaxID=4460 RepID=A0A843U6I9_COLES|nr:hypothetical protein [Colocasia esculenta]
MNSWAPTPAKRAAPAGRRPKFLLLLLALGVGVVLFGMHMITLFSGSADALGGLGQWRWGSSTSRPPGFLQHDMTDEELLWRASFVPQVKEYYPFWRVPKIAFMFLSRGPLPLRPLWDRFFTGHEGLYTIYVHSQHPHYWADYPPSSPFYGRQVPSQVTEWGEITLCDAERRLLANALLDISNEWFVLLSDSCIPLFSFNYIYNYLRRTNLSYVQVYDLPGKDGRGRYSPGMAPEVDIARWRKGSQWFEVQRDIAVAIVADVKFYPKFREFCKPDCYPDEHYLPTMLSMEVPHLLANRSITWVDWTRRPASHPGTFGMAEVNETFLRRIKKMKTCHYSNQSSSPCFLFARKFTPSSLQALLQLAPKVLGFG